MGAGCLVQGVGLVALFLIFPFGLLIGVILLVYGSTLATRWRCSICRSRLPDKHASVCAHCGATLTG